MPQIASSAIMATQNTAYNVVADFGDETQAWVSREISGGVGTRVRTPEAGPGSGHISITTAS